MRKHINNLTSGLVIVALSAIIILWVCGAGRVFAEIPNESGYVAILDFFAAVVGILIGLVAIYGIGWKFNKLTAIAKVKQEIEQAEEDDPAVEASNNIAMAIGFCIGDDQDFTPTNPEGNEGE